MIRVIGNGIETDHTLRSPLILVIKKQQIDAGGYNINEIQFNLAREEIETEIESLSDDELLVLRRLCLECSARQNTIATLAKQVIESRGHHLEEE
jgi:hypothetical protein